MSYEPTEEEKERYKEEQLIWINRLNKERNKRNKDSLKSRYPALAPFLERDKKKRNQQKWRDEWQ